MSFDLIYDTNVGTPQKVGTMTQVSLKREQMSDILHTSNRLYLATNQAWNDDTVSME